MLPGMKGQTVLKHLRDRHDDVPVLTAPRTSGRTSSEHLNLGADDYLAKPFDIQELEARLRLLLRRASGKVSPLIACGELQYDTNTRQFSCRGEVLSLTPREHAVMELLIRVPGKTVSKKEMSDKLSTLDETITASALEIYIVRLRKKLEKHRRANRHLAWPGLHADPCGRVASIRSAASRAVWRCGYCCPLP